MPILASPHSAASVATKRLRIAVAGAGYIGLAHMAVAPKSPTCMLAAIVVRGEVPPLVTARDGLANLRVTEAIARAAKTGQAVDLSLP